MSDKHITQIEEKINAVRKITAELAAGPGYEDLLRFIHRPGWTTPAELAFTLVVLEGMAEQAQTLVSMKAGLVKAAGQVKAVTEGKAAAA